MLVFLLAAAPAAAQSPAAAAPATDGHLITPPAEKAIARGLDYLAAVQQADGAWGNDTWPKHAGISGICLMALLSSGSTPGEGPHGQVVAKGVDFLLDQVKPSGFVATKWTSYGPMYGHAFATLALCEAYGMSPRQDMRPVLRRAVELIVRSQHGDGGWRYLPMPTGGSDISVSVCQLMALRAARNSGFTVPKKTIDRAIDFVRKCARPDGSFGYMPGYPWGSFACTAAGLCALQGAGIYRDRQFELSMAHLLRVAPDITPRALRGDTEHYFYGHYYAIQAAYQVGGAHFAQWYPAIRDALVTRQDRDGGWDEGQYLAKKTGNIGRAYATGMALTILQVPKANLPIFHR